MGEIERGDIVDTPYGPGVVLESHRIDDVYSLTLSVSGVDYRIQAVGLVVVGHVELPGED